MLYVRTVSYKADIFNITHHVRMIILKDGCQLYLNLQKSNSLQATFKGCGLSFLSRKFPFLDRVAFERGKSAAQQWA